MALCAIRWTRNGHVLVNVTTRSTTQPCETGPLSRQNRVPGGVPKPVPPVAMVDGQDSPLTTVWWWLEHEIYVPQYMIYMGCHPSHWRTPSFLKMVIAPTSYFFHSLGNFIIPSDEETYFSEGFSGRRKDLREIMAIDLTWPAAMNSGEFYGYCSVIPKNWIHWILSCDNSSWFSIFVLDFSNICLTLAWWWDCM